VATSQTYLDYTGLDSSDRSAPPKPGDTERIRLVAGFHRVWLKLACPFHRWNWPRPVQAGKPYGFDAHQTCFKCTTERFYNTSTLKAGPLYRSQVPPGSSR
jgi:hypothetical protein